MGIILARKLIFTLKHHHFNILQAMIESIPTFMAELANLGAIFRKNCGACQQK